SALSKLPTSGIDFDAISEDQLRNINLLGAMLYHGVNTEAGVVVRMTSVPRTVANSLGADDVREHTAEQLRPSNVREYLTGLSDTDWARHVPRGASIDGGDLNRIWRVLSGTGAEPSLGTTITSSYAVADD